MQLSGALVIVHPLDHSVSVVDGPARDIEMNRVGRQGLDRIRDAIHEKGAID